MHLSQKLHEMCRSAIETRRNSRSPLIRVPRHEIVTRTKKEMERDRCVLSTAEPDLRSDDLPQGVAPFLDAVQGHVSRPRPSGHSFDEDHRGCDLTSQASRCPRRKARENARKQAREKASEKPRAKASEGERERLPRRPTRVTARCRASDSGKALMVPPRRTAVIREAI